MRKGSVFVRDSQSRACTQYEWLVAMQVDINRERPLSSRQAKGTWCVVLGNPKDYSATEVAHHSRLAKLHRFNETIKRKDYFGHM